MTGVVTLPAGTEMVMPGDNTEMSVELIQPIAMEEGLRFAIREGGHRGRRPRRQDQQVVTPDGRRPDWPPVTQVNRPTRTFTTDRQEQKTAMAGQKIRIRLKAYDHEAIDASARRIVETVTKTGRGGRPGASADGEERVRGDPFAAVQGLVRALRDAHAQAAHRHPRPTPKTVDALMRIDLPASVDVNIQ